MNEKYIQSYQQRKWNEERNTDMKTIFYTSIVTGLLFGVAAGLGYIHTAKHSLSVPEHSRVLGKEKGFVNPHYTNTNHLERSLR